MAPPASRSQEYYKLRAEWLRLKSHILDAATDLPTLVAILDDVRRLVEERGALGLLYLDPGGGGRVELVHGWQAYDPLIRGVAESLRALRADGFLGPQDLIATLGVRSDKFLVFLGGPPGLALDAASLDSLAGELWRRVLEEMARLLPEDVGVPLQLDYGYALLQRDPMLRVERALHRALDEALYVSQRRRTRREGERTQELDVLIREGSVLTLYQPIFDLRDRHVLGHEVFTRGLPAGPFEDPEELFSLASRTGRLLDVERLARRRAIESARLHLRPGAKLFLNTSAEALADPDVAGSGFVQLVDAQGLPHGDVVLELTERVALEKPELPRRALAELKRKGFAVAIDDMGAGYASLQSIVELEPSYLKFDVSLVRNIDRSLIKRSLLETLVELSSRIGARVIAEGIEAESELQTLREMGVGLGQGHYLAPPAPVPGRERPVPR